jgi:hypothetical protein
MGQLRVDQHLAVVTSMADDSLPEHGGQLRALAARFHTPEESLLDFNASINPLPPNDALIDALCESLRGRKILTCYLVAGFDCLGSLHLLVLVPARK